MALILPMPEGMGDVGYNLNFTVIMAYEPPFISLLYWKNSYFPTITAPKGAIKDQRIRAGYQRQKAQYTLYPHD